MVRAEFGEGWQNPALPGRDTVMYNANGLSEQQTKLWKGSFY